MKAVVLAAGEGKRLEPLTNVRPKPMIPLANKPLLEHVLDAVKEAGIDEVVLVVGYKRDRIQSYFGDGDDWDLDIEYVVQEKQLGTGDAVLEAASVVDEDFLVLNGDRIIEGSIIERVVEERVRADDSPAVMAVTHVDEPGLYGAVELDDENHVTSIIEKPDPHEVRTDLINAGVYAFGPEIFDAIEATSSMGELALTDVLAEHLDEMPIRAIPYGKRWLDVSRPWDLVSVNSKLVGSVEEEEDGGTAWVDESAVVSEDAVLGDDTRVYGNASILRGSAIGDNVSIGPNATVQNSIVMSDATIEAGAVVQDAVLGENVTVGPNTTIPGGAAAVVLKDAVYRGVTFGGIVGDNAQLESAVTVVPGTFVGNGSTVGHGARVDGWFEPETTITRG